jgi:hypothetical protein
LLNLEREGCPNSLFVDLPLLLNLENEGILFADLPLLLNLENEGILFADLPLLLNLERGVRVSYL